MLRLNYQSLLELCACCHQYQLSIDRSDWQQFISFMEEDGRKKQLQKLVSHLEKFGVWEKNKEKINIKRMFCKWRVIAFFLGLLGVNRKDHWMLSKEITTYIYASLKELIGVLEDPKHNPSLECLRDLRYNLALCAALVRITRQFRGDLNFSKADRIEHCNSSCHNQTYKMSEVLAPNLDSGRKILPGVVKQ